MKFYLIFCESIIIYFLFIFTLKINLNSLRVLDEINESISYWDKEPIVSAFGLRALRFISSLFFPQINFKISRKIFVCFLYLPLNSRWVKLLLKWHVARKILSPWTCPLRIFGFIKRNGVYSQSSWYGRWRAWCSLVRVLRLFKSALGEF